MNLLYLHQKIISLRETFAICVPSKTCFEAEINIKKKREHNHFEIENLLHAIEAINYGFAGKKTGSTCFPACIYKNRGRRFSLINLLIVISYWYFSALRNDLRTCRIQLGRRREYAMIMGISWQCEGRK